MLSSILDTAAFQAQVAARLITERAHPDDDSLRIYSYGKEVQYKGLWTPEAMIARGLTLKFETIGDFSTATVVGRGLPKFFTLEQVDSDWGRVKLVDDDENVTVSDAPTIDWDAPALVAEKLNGALGLAYMAPNGLVSVSTKGSFGSLEAAVSDRILDNYDRQAFSNLMKNEIAGKTPLFEIITPLRPHPVNYGELEDLMYLGLMDNATGEWTPASAEDIVPKTIGFPIAEQLAFSTLREAVEAPYVANTEGLVVTVLSDNEQTLYKVKPNEYLTLRKLFYSMESKRLAAYVMTLSPTQISSIEKPEDLDLASHFGVERNDYNTAMITEREVSVWEDFIKPMKAYVHTSRDEVVKILETCEIIDGDYDRREVVAKSQNRGTPFKLLMATYDDVIGGSSKAFSVARSLVLKSVS